VPYARAAGYAEGLAVGVGAIRRGFSRRRTEGVETLQSRHVSAYAEGRAVGVAATPFPSAVRPQSYAEGPDAESHLPAVGV
jgi:hypothetical protein